MTDFILLKNGASQFDIWFKSIRHIFHQQDAVKSIKCLSVSENLFSFVKCPLCNSHEHHDGQIERKLHPQTDTYKIKNAEDNRQFLWPLGKRRNCLSIILSGTYSSRVVCRQEQVSKDAGKQELKSISLPYPLLSTSCEGKGDRSMSKATTNIAFQCQNNTQWNSSQTTFLLVTEVVLVEFVYRQPSDGASQRRSKL